MKNKIAFCVVFQGGGIRGLYSAKLLELTNIFLIEKFRENIYNFDLAFGTSIGSINATLFALNYSPENIVNFYLENAKNVFNKNIFNSILNNILIKNYEYSNSGLKKVLKKIFKNQKISDVKNKLFIPARNITLNQNVFFTNIKKKNNEYLYDIILASCSAPTYFPSHNINNYSYIDVGFSLSNPVESARLELNKLGYENENIFIISFGTGKSNEKSMTSNEYNSLSKIGLIKPLISEIIDSANEIEDYLCKKELGSNYLNLDSNLLYSSKELDNISNNNLNNLIEDAKMTFNLKKDDIKMFFDLLFLKKQKRDKNEK